MVKLFTLHTTTHEVTHMFPGGPEGHLPGTAIHRGMRRLRDLVIMSTCKSFPSRAEFCFLMAISNACAAVDI